MGDVVIGDKLSYQGASTPINAYGDEYGSTELTSVKQKVTYQASSPDEVALVSWTETVGLTLLHRDLNIIKLRTSNGTFVDWDLYRMIGWLRMVLDLNLSNSWNYECELWCLLMSSYRDMLGYRYSFSMFYLVLMRAIYNPNESICEFGYYIILLGDVLTRCLLP